MCASDGDWGGRQETAEEGSQDRDPGTGKGSSSQTLPFPQIFNDSVQKDPLKRNTEMGSQARDRREKERDVRFSGSHNSS